MSTQTPQPQIVTLQGQIKSQQQQILKLEVQRTELTNNNNNLFTQANDDAILFQAIQKALKQPVDQPARELPTWCANVMSKLPPGTVL